MCSSCLAASGHGKQVWSGQHGRYTRAAPVTCYNCKQYGHYSYDCPSDSQPKLQKLARHDKGATGKSGATGSGDGLPTVDPRRQRSGEFSRLNRQENRLHLQTSVRLEIVAQVAAKRAGGLYLSADQVKTWQEHLDFIDKEVSTLKAAVESGAASGQQLSSMSSQQEPASEQQPSEPTLSGKKKQEAGKKKAKKAAVEAFRVAQVKQEIVAANEGSSYEDIAQYIELELSSGRILPEVIEQGDFEYGTHDV